MKQYSIRQLLLVTLIASLALGWLVDRRNIASKSPRFQLQVTDEQAFIVDTESEPSLQQRSMGGITLPGFLQGELPE